MPLDIYGFYSYVPFHPAHEGRFMRRSEVERIGEWVGAGDAASLGQIEGPPTRLDGFGRESEVWCGACAPCFARTAPGRLGTPPGRHYDRSARSIAGLGLGAKPSSQEARARS